MPVLFSINFFYTNFSYRFLTAREQSTDARKFSGSFSADPLTFEIFECLYYNIFDAT